MSSTASCATYTTHRPLSSSFLGLPYRVLNINHRKELLRGLWAEVLQGLSGFGIALGPGFFQDDGLGFRV